MKSLLLVWILSAFLLLAGPSAAAEPDAYWELGAGAGLNLDGIGTNQVILAPALLGRIPGSRTLWYRVEATFELIKDGGGATFVGGVSPFFRWYLSDAGVRPFAEIGAGVSAMTRNHTATKDSGGVFTFTPSAGIGVRLGNSAPATVSIRFRHLSNSHIYRKNQSLNTLYFLVAFGF